jgi:hypothetical protein
MGPSKEIKTAAEDSIAAKLELHRTRGWYTEDDSPPAMTEERCKSDT